MPLTRKKVGLYDPFLDVMGGGERHILSILQVLESEGYDASIFWDTDLTKHIENTLNLPFQSLTFVKNVFKKVVNYILIIKIKVLVNYYWTFVNNIPNFLL